MTHRKILIHLGVALLTVLPFIAFAQQSEGIRNPLNPNFSSVPKFIAGILQVMVQVGLPVVALAFLYSGFMFVKARGNSEQLGPAKENFKFVVIGAFLVLGAWVIATLIGNTVSQVVQGGSPFQ